MSAIVKGTALPILVSDHRIYIAETKSYIVEQEYQGPELAIKGLEAQYIARGLNYRITNNGPVYSLFVSTPEQTVSEALDRWEIFTESAEKSLFELDHVADEATAYDNAIDSGEPTFREACEEAVRKKKTEIEANAIALPIIKHLRAGVTGWQLDLIGIRRTRRLEAYQANNGIRQNLDAGLFIYSTAQLNLPPLVAFVAPPTPSDVSDLFRWGWRKRSQRVEIQGNWVEQQVDLLLAPWSFEAYDNATGPLAW